MTSTTTARSRAAMLFAAPAVLLVGLLLHPYIAVPRAEDVAEAAASDPTRWGLAHLAVGVGSGLLALAFVALRSHLREAGEDRWSGLALPLAVLGCALTAILTGMEFAPLTAAETGGDVAGAQEELAVWFVPVVAASGLAFALGALGFAVAIARSRILGRGLTRVVVAALIALAVARFVPLGVSFYVAAIAGAAAFWPFTYVLWESKPTPARERRPTPVTSE
jgi:hypothetical protein